MKERLHIAGTLLSHVNYNSGHNVDMAKVKRTLSLSHNAARALTREARCAGPPRSTWLSLLLRRKQFDFAVSAATSATVWRAGSTAMTRSNAFHAILPKEAYEQHKQNHGAQ